MKQFKNKFFKTIHLSVAFLIVMGTLSSSSLLAQSPYNESLYFKDVSAHYITTEGEVGEVQTIYHPILLKSPQLNLGTVGSEGVSKDQLQAIYVAGEIWMLKPTPAGKQWVLMNEQGAINSITYITSETEHSDIIQEKMSRELVNDYQSKNIQIITGNLYEKRGGNTYSNTDLILGFKNKMSEMTEEYEELSKKIKNKESGYKLFNLGKIVTEYNHWYAENHPNEIKTFTPESFGLKGVKEPVSLKEGIAEIKQQKAEQEEKKSAKLASRPTEPSAEIASAKPNKPVRKESFPEKVKRIEADGNKIGVLFSNPYNYVKPYAASSFGSGLGLRDTVPAYEMNLGEMLVKKLNASFNTTIFELVDLNQIPYREVNVLGSRLTDDWWSTKYKILLTYSLDSYYQFIINTTQQTEGTYRVFSSITGTEFSMDGNKPQQDILFSTFNMGSYYLQLGEVEGKLEAESIAEAMENFNAEVKADLVIKELEEGLEKRYDKLIKKKLD